MKKVRGLAVFLALAGACLAGGCGESVDANQWPGEPLTVTCPWAVGGVVDIVNRALATYGQEVFGQPVAATNDFVSSGSISISDEFLVAMSSMLGDGGNVALTNYLKNRPNSPNLIIGSENAFAVMPSLRKAQLQPFSYNDFEPVISLCSSIFVLTADAKLNVTDLDSLKAYGWGKTLRVAVGGSASIEGFMVRQLFKELGLDLSVVSYNGANVALEALMNGEVHLAVSHQSQAKSGVEAGVVVPVVLFAEKGAEEGMYAGTKGVGEYGYTAFCKNRSFLMARRGTDPAIIQKIYDAYKRILSKDEVRELFRSMMIESELLDGAAIDRHIAEVKAMVKANL